MRILSWAILVVLASFASTAFALSPSDFYNSQLMNTMAISNFRIVSARTLQTNEPIPFEGGNIITPYTDASVSITFAADITSFFNSADARGTVSINFDGAENSPKIYGGCAPFSFPDFGIGQTRTGQYTMTVHQSYFGKPFVMSAYASPAYCYANSQPRFVLWSNIIPMTISINGAQPKVNLSIDRPTTSSTPFIMSPSDSTDYHSRFSAKPNVPTTIYVNVKGSGINPLDNRSAIVSLKIKGRPVMQQYVSLQEVANRNGYNLPFPATTFTPDEVGKLDLAASVNTDGAIEETDLTDNTVQDFAYVLCKVEDAGRIVPFNAQTEAGWKNDPFGITANSRRPGTMGDYGCSVTAFTMLLKSYGIYTAPLGSPALPYLGIKLPDGLNGEALTPGILNKTFSNYTSNSVVRGSIALNAINNPIWPGMAEVARAGYKAQCSKNSLCNPNDAYKAISYKTMTSSFDDTEGSADRKFINREICNGNPVILRFSKVGDGEHFMLAKGTTVAENGEVTYLVHNPGRTSGTNRLRSELVAQYPNILGYILYRPSADPSMLVITASKNVHLVITDPLGRRLGFDPNTSTSIHEIPGAFYGTQSINNTGEESQENSVLVAERYIAISQDTDIPSGNYSIQVYGLESGEYHIDYRGFDSTGTTNNSSLKTGSIQAGQLVTININHAATLAPTPTANLFVNEYSIKKSPWKTYSHANIILRGQLIPYSKSVILLKDQITVSIGGITGVNTTFYASDFKTVKKRNETLYLYNKHHAELSISSNGEFEIKIKDADLTDLDKNQIQYISIKVDNLFADKRINTDCRKNACKLKPHHGTCHFDKEDEE